MLHSKLNMFRISSGFTAMVVAVLGFGPCGARGAVTVYTTAGSWQAVVSSGTTFDFEGIAPANGFTPPNPTILGLTVTVPISYYVVDSGYASGYDSLNGTDSLQGAAGASGSTVLQFGSAVTAFGALVGYTNDTATPTPGVFTAQLYDGVTLVGSAYTSPSLTNGFIGFTSDVSFDRVQFVNSLTTPNYLTLRFADAVPEPGRFAILMSGLAAIVMRRRRERSPVRPI